MLYSSSFPQHLPSFPHILLSPHLLLFSLPLKFSLLPSTPFLSLYPPLFMFPQSSPQLSFLPSSHFISFNIIFHLLLICIGDIKKYLPCFSLHESLYNIVLNTSEELANKNLWDLYSLSPNCETIRFMKRTYCAVYVHFIAYDVRYTLYVSTY